MHWKFFAVIKQPNPNWLTRPFHTLRAFIANRFGYYQFLSATMVTFNCDPSSELCLFSRSFYQSCLQSLFSFYFSVKKCHLLMFLALFPSRAVLKPTYKPSIKYQWYILSSTFVWRHWSAADMSLFLLAQFNLGNNFCKFFVFIFLTIRERFFSLYLFYTYFSFSFQHLAQQFC